MSQHELRTDFAPQVLEFMEKRRSSPAKVMGGPGPSEAELERIATIAMRVPDHGKIAPWRFIRYSADAAKRLDEAIVARALELDPELSAEARKIEENRMRRSPTVVGLISAPRDHPKVPHWEQELSCGAAGFAWVMAANASGYDAQWLTEWISFDETLMPLFGCRDGERMAGFIHIGTRTMPKTERARPNPSDIFLTME